MTMEMTNWMKTNSKICLLALTAVGLASCKVNNQSSVVEMAVLQKQNDSLALRIQELEMQNAAQEERIKDLEDDLEGVITFLGNEMNY